MMIDSAQKCTWQDVSAQVSTVNPSLSSLINALNPGKAYPLYKVRYRFGEHIVRSGQFLYPRGGGRSGF